MTSFKDISNLFDFFQETSLFLPPYYSPGVFTMISDRPPLSPPPLHHRPPILTSSQIDDRHFPFSENLENAPIPESLKAHMMPPAETLLRLDHPCSRYPAHTPSFSECVGHTCALPYFKHKDAVDAITPEDLSLNFGIYNIQPAGYTKVHYPPALPHSYSALYHVKFEVLKQT